MESYFEKLRALQKNAYAPYSNFCVASILVGENGEEFCGVNVENASYGGTICAERSALVSAVSQKGGKQRFKAMHLLAGNGDGFAMPCGLCRQFMSELLAADFSITVYNGSGASRQISMEELLPYAFTKDDL